MKKTLLSLIGLVLFFPSAQAVDSINVQTFNPSTSDHFVLLEDAYPSVWPKIGNLYFGANYNYSSEPFVTINSGTGLRDNVIVSSVQTFDLMAGFKASSRFALFFGVPFHFIKFNGSVIPSIPPKSVSALGDMKILGKIRITDDDSNTHIALVPEIHLPTGNTENFVSDASTLLGIRATLEREFAKFTLNINLGFASASNSYYNPSGAVTPIDNRKRFNFGIGGFMPFTPLWGMNLEFNSWNMIPFDKNNNPNELYAGLRHSFSENSILTFGASIGKIGGPSGQNFRGIIGFRFNLYDEDASQPRPLSTASALPVETPRVVMKKKKIELSTPIDFQEDSSLLTKNGKELLDEVASVISKNLGSFSKIQIDGHTNVKGSAKHNLWLSLERAKSVKNYLVGKGIAPSLFEARGFGISKPKVAANHPKAMELNRRVEFNVIP